MVFNKEFNVYDRHYNYDEMKVMSVITQCKEAKDLDYEDMCKISEAIFAHWIDGRDESEDEKYALYPWLEFESQEEDGYIQKYAERVAPLFIELYMFIEHHKEI